jgi:hypothetical protein
MPLVGGRCSVPAPDVRVSRAPGITTIGREQMLDIRSGLRDVADRQRWAARGASFVAKAKATKAVWFPPKPQETGKKAASTVKKASKRTTRKTTGAAKKTANGTKKASAARATKS